MDLAAVLPLLGAAANEPRVIAFLKELGVSSPPKLKRGDTDVNVDAHNAGLYLVFTDEAFHRAAPKTKIGGGALLLTNASIYCVANKPFKAFAGSLPFGMEVSTSRDTLRARLGPPEVSDDGMCLDRWFIEGLWVFA